MEQGPDTTPKTPEKKSHSSGPPADTKSLDDKVVYDPLYRYLEDSEKRAAAADLLKYPKVIRSEVDPPVPGQTHGLISFRLSEEPRVTRSGVKIYGLFKLRGNFGSQEMAMSDSANRVLSQTSTADKIFIPQVGHWAPITMDETFCQQRLDARMVPKGNDSDAQVVELRDMKDMSLIDQQKQEETKRKDIEERIAVLRGETDIHDKPESVDYYAMKRVVEMNLREEIIRNQKAVAAHKEKLKTIYRELHELGEKNPEYLHQWLEEYNIGRRKVGLKDLVWTNKDDYTFNKNVSDVVNLDILEL
jgi:hypothetical protein